MWLALRSNPIPNPNALGGKFQVGISTRASELRACLMGLRNSKEVTWFLNEQGEWLKMSEREEETGSWKTFKPW